jgi:hypothetical protein
LNNCQVEPQELFHDLIINLGQIVQLDAVILFGSRATGKATEDSDYDLVFIGNFLCPRIERVKMVLRLKPPRIPIDVFCYTPEEFERAFQAFSLTAIDAVGEGIVLLGDIFVQPFKERYADLVHAGMHKGKSILILPAA